ERRRVRRRPAAGGRAAPGGDHPLLAHVDARRREGDRGAVPDVPGRRRVHQRLRPGAHLGAHPPAPGAHHVRRPPAVRAAAVRAVPAVPPHRPRADRPARLRPRDLARVGPGEGGDRAAVGAARVLLLVADALRVGHVPGLPGGGGAGGARAHAPAPALPARLGPGERRPRRRLHRELAPHAPAHPQVLPPRRRGDRAAGGDGGVRAARRPRRLLPRRGAAHPVQARRPRRGGVRAPRPAPRRDRRGGGDGAAQAARRLRRRDVPRVAVRRRGARALRAVPRAALPGRGGLRHRPRGGDGLGAPGDRVRERRRPRHGGGRRDRGALPRADARGARRRRRALRGARRHARARAPGGPRPLLRPRPVRGRGPRGDRPALAGAPRRRGRRPGADHPRRR
ncbi:MAG: Glycosyltransferase, partial [uncultured Gemmatimonadaceae bacterium]